MRNRLFGRISRYVLRPCSRLWLLGPALLLLVPKLTIARPSVEILDLEAPETEVELPTNDPELAAPRQDLRDQYQQAQRFLRRGKLDQAEDILVDLVGTYPGMRDYVLRMLADLELARLLGGDRSAADRVLAYADGILAEPSSNLSGWAYYLKARAYEGLARYDRAEAQYLEALTKGGGPGEGAIYYRLGVMAEAMGRAGDAFTHYALAHRRSWSSLRRQTQEAMDRVRPKASNEAQAIDWYIRVDEFKKLVSRRRYTQTSRLIKAALEECKLPDVRDELRRLQGICYLRKGRYDDGSEVLIPLLLSELERGEANWETLDRLQRSMKYNDARATRRALLRRFVEAKPNEFNLKAYFVLASLMVDDKRYDAAEALYQEVFDRFPGSEQALDAQWRLAWGRIRRGEIEPAIHALKEHSAATPADSLERARALYWLGRMQLKNGDRAAGELVLEQVVTDFPDSYYGAMAEWRLTGGYPPVRFNGMERIAGVDKGKEGPAVSEGKDRDTALAERQEGAAAKGKEDAPGKEERVAEEAVASEDDLTSDEEPASEEDLTSDEEPASEEDLTSDEEPASEDALAAEAEDSSTPDDPLLEAIDSGLHPGPKEEKRSGPKETRGDGLAEEEQSDGLAEGEQSDAPDDVPSEEVVGPQLESLLGEPARLGLALLFPGFEEHLSKVSDPAAAAHLERAKELWLMGNPQEARAEIRGASRLPEVDAQALWMCSALSHAMGSIFYGVRYGHQYLNALGDEETTPARRALAYPMPYREAILHHSGERKLEPAFIASLIQQESTFREKIRSPAGARGLMQIMSYTGREVAGWLEIRGYSSRYLTRADFNLRLGTEYVRAMLEQFNESPVKTLAAYNAGPHRVTRWIEMYGDLEDDYFAEEIPFTETRKYVRLVLRNFNGYLNTYGGRVATRPNTAPLYWLAEH